MVLGTASSGTLPTSVEIPIHLIHRLTNLNEINRLLNETLAKERSVDNDLDRLLSKRAELERSFIVLNTPTAENLELVHADCEQLLSSVQGTAAMAEHISSKVRKLDTVQNNVQATLDKITLILDRSNCVNGVQAAMDGEDYEAAANYISTFLDLEVKLAGSTQDVDAGQAEDHKQVLLVAKQQLEVVVDRRFDDAVVRHDSVAAIRFARLYKPLGKQAEGLKRFGEFLKLLVGGQARTAYAALSDQIDAGKKVDYAAVLSLLFKDLALALDNNERMLHDTFGQESTLDVVAALQAECDVQGTRLLQRYLEAAKVGQLVKEVTNRKRSGGTGAIHASPDVKGGAAGGAASGVDHRAVEGAIEELLRLCQLSEEYNQHMLGKMRAALGPGQPLTAARESTFRSGQFNVTVRELLGYYMSLEEFYLDETASMAIRIDEATGGLTSTMVDDVFFILRKCGSRALASSSVQSACALLAELNNVLANAFRNALQGKLAVGPGKLLAARSAAIGEGTAAPTSSTAAADFTTALNNCDVSSEYVAKLRSELDGYMNDLFPAPSDRERVRNVLSDLGKTSGDFRTAAARATEAVAEAIMPRLRPLLDDVASASYTLNDAEYAANEADGGWPRRVLAAMELHLTWLHPILTTNNYEAVFHAVTDKVVARLESTLARKAFNQLGGLQLDRDTRLLVSQLSEMTSRTVRDKLSRLNQMAIILGLETVEEFLDYWGDDSGHITWRLSPAEVRAVLTQRTDFSKDAIAALQL